VVALFGVGLAVVGAVAPPAGDPNHVVDVVVVGPGGSMMMRW
jgi:hypothetical protein